MPPRFPHGPLAAGVVQVEDEIGTDPALEALIRDAGGLWQAGDYYADSATIVETAHLNGVRALRLDARDLLLLRDLPELEILHLRSDGRPVLDPVATLPNLRGLIVELSALRGTIRLEAHPRLELLKMPLSGRGGRENLSGVLHGHPAVRHLRLGEVPLTSLDALAAGFPALRTLHIHGAERMRSVGAVEAWADALDRLWLTWAPLRSFDGLEVLRSLRCFGSTFSRVRTIAPLAHLPALRTLSILGTLPSLVSLAGKAGLRIARLTMPDDGDLDPLGSWPDLVALVGRRWLGDRAPVPYLEDLPATDPRRKEWFDATGTPLLLAP